jgi:anti-sigma regulatory factor (Ser/Thr protein kinase)
MSGAVGGFQGRAGGSTYASPCGYLLPLPHQSSPHRLPAPPAGTRRSYPAATGPALATPTEAMPFVYSTNLSEVRVLAETQARRAGLPEDRVVDFVIAVSEVAGNTVRHARTEGSIEIWRSGGEIICEIRDGGVITDPAVVGRLPPAADANGGHGLWLVHQICDRVELQSDDNGTVIRLHMALPAR